jgi:D-xylose transport system permease protein
MSQVATQPSSPAAPAAPSAFSLASLRRRVAEGDLGSLPVVIGLIVIWLIFWRLNPNFLTPRNLTNLVLQIVVYGMISSGVVLVLLLGEIDLSIGAVSGLCAAVMAVVNVKAGQPAAVALIVALLAGAVIGLLQGTWFTRFHVPSFVVTLAGLLAWQGALLWVLGDTGTVNLNDKLIVGLANTFFPTWVGWVIAAAAIVLFAASTAFEHRRRQAAGLVVGSPPVLVVQVIVFGAVMLGAVAVLNADRGVPSGILILLGFVIILDYLTRRTRFGRHIYAVGGNPEAARRAGINVTGIRIAVFGMCSFMAAAGGILGASRLLAVNQSSGGSDTLLNSIASAVIGGVSLFGGRGSVWAAPLGALVIGSISDGMDLLALSSSVKFMITGAVLLLAVTIDAVSRRGRQSAGRA